MKSTRFYREIICASFGALLFTSVLVNAATKEHAVKAGLIYNITKFVVWPSDSRNNEKFNLCIMNSNELGGSLNALRGKLVSNKPLVLRRELKDQVLNVCHIAFISGDDAQNVQEILQKLSHFPVLTISDHPDFINQGGMVGLVRDGSRLGFEINLKMVGASKLHMGAQLLKLAKRVKGLK